MAQVEFRTRGLVANADALAKIRGIDPGRGSIEVDAQTGIIKGGRKQLTPIIEQLANNGASIEEVIVWKDGISPRQRKTSLTALRPKQRDFWKDLFFRPSPSKDLPPEERIYYKALGTLHDDHALSLDSGLQTAADWINSWTLMTTFKPHHFVRIIVEKSGIIVGVTLKPLSEISVTAECAVLNYVQQMIRTRPIPKRIDGSEAEKIKKDNKDIETRAQDNMQYTFNNLLKDNGVIQTFTAYAEKVGALAST